MVYIPAGRFLMGNNGSGPYGRSDEIPQHPVYLSGYWLGKNEVTRREYLQFMEAGGYSNPAYWSSDGWVWRTQSWRAAPIRWFPEQDWGTGTFVQTDEHPVVGVTYYEAEAYCSWAGGHLPSEGQWEKAASWTGGYPNTWPWGNLWDAETCNNAVDHSPAGGGFGQCQTAPVGSYPSGASPYGLHDMAGNVWEWCRDWHDFDYYSVSPSITPMGPLTGIQRVLRGGSWRGMESHTRCSVRYSDYPREDWDDDAGGFRLAR